jgi:hypothetical protein
MPAVRAATSEAVSHGDKIGTEVRLSLTTNGTLLSPSLRCGQHGWAARRP